MYVHKTEQNTYCPTEYGANIFGGKWKPRILCLLSIKGQIRYKEIKNLTPGITDQVLANVLKELMTAEVVQRIQYDEMPVRVEYSLTEKGENLIPVLHSICRWVAASYGEGVMGTETTCPFKALKIQEITL